MYLPKAEMCVIKSLRRETQLYYEMFNTYFPPFNHDEWFDVEGKAAIDVYAETLRKCVRTRTAFINPYKDC